MSGHFISLVLFGRAPIARSVTQKPFGHWPLTGSTCTIEFSEPPSGSWSTVRVEIKRVLNLPIDRIALDQPWTPKTIFVRTQNVDKDRISKGASNFVFDEALINPTVFPAKVESLIDVVPIFLRKRS